MDTNETNVIVSYLSVYHKSIFKNHLVYVHESAVHHN